MTDPFFTYRPVLDLLGNSEGTDKGRGYNETLAYGEYTGGDRELVAMTLDQIDELQTAMLAHPKNKWNSSALGRYQIVRTTLRKIRKKLNLSGQEVFSASMQDRLACFLLGGRGIDRWLAGKMSLNALLTALAKEWASLPTPSGKGYYSGQNASVSVSQVVEALVEVERRRKLHGADVQAAPDKGNSGGAVAAGGTAVAVGTGAAAVSNSHTYLDLLIYGGLAAAAAVVAVLVWRNRDSIGAALKSLTQKNSGRKS